MQNIDPRSYKNMARSGESYTTYEIVYDLDLDLPDVPFFYVRYEGKTYVIQQPLSWEDVFKKNADLSYIKWTLIRITREWIPLFHLSNKEDNEKLLSFLKFERTKCYNPDIDEKYQVNFVEN